jgi:hypothetical protein
MGSPRWDQGSAEGIIDHDPGLGTYKQRSKSAPVGGEVGYGPGCEWMVSGVTQTAPVGVSRYWNIGGNGFGSNAKATWVPDGNPSGTGLVTLAAATTITPLAHAGCTMLLNLAAGFTVTMPAATGSGIIYRFAVLTVTTSSGTYVITCPANTLFGNVLLGISASGGAASTFVATTSTGLTSVTLDHLHQGGASMGDWLSFQDVAAGTWFCTGIITGTSSVATPFS